MQQAMTDLFYNSDFPPLHNRQTSLTFHAHYKIIISGSVGGKQMQLHALIAENMPITLRLIFNMLSV